MSSDDRRWFDVSATGDGALGERVQGGRVEYSFEVGVDGDPVVAVERRELLVRRFGKVAGEPIGPTGVEGVEDQSRHDEVVGPVAVR